MPQGEAGRYGLVGISWGEEYEDLRSHDLAYS